MILKQFALLTHTHMHTQTLFIANQFPNLPNKIRSYQVRTGTSSGMKVKTKDLMFIFLSFLPICCLGCADGIET